MKVVLVKNQGYKWYEGKGKSFFKGYFFDNNGVLFRGQKALDVISEEVHDTDSLVRFLKKIDGIFSFITLREDCCFCAVDRARSMPLFFVAGGGIISDSAEVIRKELNISKEDIGKYEYLSFYAKGYIDGNYTVYSQIKQLDCGEALSIITNQKEEIIRYYNHISAVSQITYSEMLLQLDKTALKVFQRLKEVIAGRPVAISLSGGYDSRTVACMLKRVGIENVSCYTYGKQGSFEVEQSKKNAEALGFRWVYVEHTDERVNCVLDEEGKKYLSYYETHDCLPYIQNYPAVRELVEKGWFEEGTVFLTGLCGDMPSGYYIPPKENIQYDNKFAAEWLYSEIYARAYPDEQFYKRCVFEILEDMSKNKVEVTDYQTFASAIDCVYTRTCHAHAFLNMNRSHDYYGYEWLLPMWDAELLDLWYSMPVDFRFRQKIYEDWLLNGLCAPYGIGTRKKTVGYSVQPIKKKLTYFAGSILAYICFHLGIPFKRSYDFNNWAPLELNLYKHLKSKKTVIWHKAALYSLVIQYTLQNRYGVKNMLDAKKRIVKS